MQNIPSTARATLLDRKQFLEFWHTQLFNNYPWEKGESTPTAEVAQKIMDPHYQPPFNLWDFIVHVQAVAEIIEQTLESKTAPDLSWLIRLTDAAGLLQGSTYEMFDKYVLVRRMEKEATRKENIVKNWGRASKAHFYFTAEYCRDKKIDLDSIKPWALADLIRKAYRNRNGSKGCPSKDTFFNDIIFLKTGPQYFSSK